MVLTCFRINIAKKTKRQKRQRKRKTKESNEFLMQTHEGTGNNRDKRKEIYTRYRYGEDPPR
jgi:hypothetical protein